MLFYNCTGREIARNFLGNFPKKMEHQVPLGISGFFLMSASFRWNKFLLSIMRLFIFGLGLFLGGVAHLSAANFFVDYSAGSDANSGTSPRTPWKHSPGDPSAGGLPAVMTLTAGDAVFFRGGVTYVFTSISGIALKWKGASGKPITYDGNSNGSWGTGRARFSDNNGGNDITAFSAPLLTEHLVFRALEFTRIGGAATLPTDSGTALNPRFGGGLAFRGGAANVTIDSCVFRELGYWFNQKPMGAQSLNGVGISATMASGLKVTNCQFSRVAVAIDFAAATTLDSAEISRSSFNESVVWPLRLPVSATGVSTAGVVFAKCTTLPDTTLAENFWQGYGQMPSTDVATVNAGASATIFASAVASPQPSYQWRRNGIVLQGESASSLRLVMVSSKDAGVYIATAINVAGSAQSNAAVLVVNTTVSLEVAPVILTQPISRTASAGSTVSFSVVAGGTPAPTYQWRKNGATIRGAVAGTLDVYNVTDSANSTYSVVMSNNAGSVTSSGATLTVPVPGNATTAPAFSVHPASQTVNASTSVTFSALASGSPAPTYQWRKNGTAISGATSATLTLSNVTTATAGTYTVTASNAVNSVTSNGATLTVWQAPSFALQPASQTVNASSKVTFTAAATGNPTPTYQWRKNGAAISGATAATLTLSGVTAAAAGTYAVTVTNPAGSLTSSGATLAVRQSPTFTLHPASQTVKVSSTVTFTAAASGSPTPTNQWRKNGVAIPGATSAPLTLNNVTTTAAGTYTVLATNTGGTATSGAATLVVQSPPVVTLHPADESVAVGGSVTFSAAAVGVPAPTYQWRNDGVAIPGATAASLTLSNVALGDIAAYSVAATNLMGTEISNVAQLTVVPVAGSPLATIAIDVGATSEVTVPFTISGTTNKSVLIRVSGPALVAFGVSGMPDPILDLLQGTTLMFRNDNWGGTRNVAYATLRVGTFPWTSRASKDAALIATLPPGTYSAVVSGVNGSAGMVLIEVYELP